jgi:photosystem II stability/assembly factor-like uncharacterized protein
MKKLILIILTATLMLSTYMLEAQKKTTPPKEEPKLSSQVFKNFKFRNIGPSFMSGRIADIAIHPKNPNTWYVAVGSGGVWKTTNAGVSWTPVFDDQPVYSIGCISIDPQNPAVIWVGTGENVGGRHVGFGDGIYKSTDEGKTWKNMGLKRTEHISKIIVHPKNSDIIYVAAQGPLWNKGGERGFYKSSDGGKSWQRTLGDDEWTGVTDIDIHPQYPERIYAATWQRHRTVAAYMGGGPGSGLYRSDDGGSSWKKLSGGLPAGDMGKIGLIVSPQRPEVIYAAIELERRKGAVYRSENHGESWSKQSETVSGGTGPHYYQELYASPHTFDLIYLADVTMQVSNDGGKTFRRMKDEFRHGDDHALAFRPNDPDYLLVGSDGGLYESFDKEENWRFISNLPVTQFYKIALDHSKPFYNVYGGTQDNCTQAGPSRTDNMHGIGHFDWEVVIGGDGHQPATEPGNPDIAYAQSQQGFLYRLDRKTGESVFIQPQPGENEGFERFNWDAPILVSPHSPTRLYFASHRVWRSDNRGDDWTAISGDLTQPVERISLPIMGKNQSWDAAWDFYAMSTYNTISSLTESPVKEGLIYAGTDDGLIQLTEDEGKNWKKIPLSNLPNLPAGSFINDIKADLFDESNVYIALDNHKTGDFRPYLYKSTDKGKTWKSIKSDLPDTLLVWRLVQDHINKNLLFLGTEFGIYFSINAGENWIKFTGGLPVISFRDLAIHQAENDLVAASFGRGIFILDDYSPLREINPANLENKALLFKPRDAYWYIERSKLAGRGKGMQGQAHYLAENPPFGANFTLFLKNDYRGPKEIRKENEKKLKKENAGIPFPGWEKLDEELKDEGPVIWLNIMDNQKNVIRKLKTPKTKGIHRVNWDLRMSAGQMINLDQQGREQWRSGALVTPGTYTAFLSLEENGKISDLSGMVEFIVKPLREGSLKSAGYDEMIRFREEITTLQTETSLFFQRFSKSLKKTAAMKEAFHLARVQDPALLKAISELNKDLSDIQKQLFGSPSKSEVGEKDLPTLNRRLGTISRVLRSSTYGPTGMMKNSLEIAKKEFSVMKQKFEPIYNEIIPGLLKQLKEAGAPPVEE